MKKIRLNNYLCLMFIPLFLIALLSPMNAFASQNDAGMEVIAHIEAPNEEPSSSVITDTDSKSPQTGNDSNMNILIPMLFICCGTLTVTAVCKKEKHTTK